MERKVGSSEKKKTKSGEFSLEEKDNKLHYSVANKRSLYYHVY